MGKWKGEENEVYDWEKVVKKRNFKLWRISGIFKSRKIRKKLEFMARAGKLASK